MAWTAEDDFDSYSNGASINTLNGGTGWAAGWVLSGGTLTITNGVSYDPSNSATATSAGLTSNNAERQLSSDFSGAGIIYVALRRTSNSSGSIRWNFRSTGDSGRLSVLLDSDGQAKIKSETAGTTQNIGAYSANTWYVIRITVNNATGTATAAMSSGTYGSAGTFGSDSSSVSFTTGDWRYVLIDFDPTGPGTGVTNYWDYISPTSPFTTPTAFVKTMNGVVWADVKSVMGVT